jgi:DNA-binding XRE family transcriptional regulator
MSAGGSATGNLSQINLTVTMATNNRLKAARVLKGITQRKLAELVGTREIEISRIETGRCEPVGPMKEKIAAVLGKPTFEIFDY